MAGKKKFISPDLEIEELSAALYLSKEELRRTNERLKAAELSRNELIANVSRDLRSPLTALRSTVDYMDTLENYDKEEIKELIGLMQGKLSVLERLVNDFFLLTTIENLSIPFHMQRIEIGTYLEEFFFNRETDEKYAERVLELKVPEKFPYLVMIDPIRLEQALDNLFQNALKYSDKGASIILEAYAIKGKVCMIVKDTGIGIPQDKVERIFERSYMVDTSRTPGMKTGCGLGLTIVKQIVERLGGQITCKSIEGKGSEFRITLPIEEREE